MANSKISALPAATTPAAGTEVLPIVQSSATKQISIANLTAGRSVSGISFVPTGSTIPTNGLYLPAANAVGLSTNSANAIYIDSAQQVGIGITPNTKLQVAGGFQIGVQAATNGFIQYFNATNDSYGYIYSDGTQFSIQSTYSTVAGYKPVNIFTGGSKRLQVETSGNVTVSTGNVVQGTAAKGVNFTANTPQAGMTSQLLNWYEEGTLTPTWNGGTVTVGEAKYTRVGRLVTLFYDVTFGASASATESSLTYPFTLSVSTAGGFVIYTDYGASLIVSIDINGIHFRTAVNTGTMACLSIATKRVIFGATYFV